MRKKTLSVLLLALFALSIVAIAFPVRADILAGTVEIIQPDKVVPGGAIEVNFDVAVTDIEGTYVYFYLSLDADPDISTGDIRLKVWTGEEKMSRDDVGDDIRDITLYVPTGVTAEDYYVKVSDSSKRGATATVSSNTVEVVTEDLPTITVDPTSDTVWAPPCEVDVEGSDIPSDYWFINSGVPAELYWTAYESLGEGIYPIPSNPIATEDVEDGSFKAEDVVIPYKERSYMGVHKIIVLLSDGVYTLGTFVDFEVEPAVDRLPVPAEFSIGAGVDDQGGEFIPYGFPEGTIKADTIYFVIRNIRTGAVEEAIKSSHDEVSITWDGTTEGEVEFVCSGVDDAPEGTVDLKFATFTLEDVFVSSSAADPGDYTKFLGKMTETEGHIGDDVKFLAINFPAGDTVDVTFEDGFGPVSVTGGVGETADDNGGWYYTFTLEGLPGGEYTVKLWSIDGSRRYIIGTFKVLSEVVYYKAGVEITSAHVGDLISIEGTAFPIDAEFKTIVIGTGTVKLDDWVSVDPDTFEWISPEFEVPHTSGGGVEVDVLIKGRDKGTGKAITVSGKITIDPVIWTLAEEYTETLCKYLDPDGEWYAIDDGLGWVFAGNPMKIEGYGYLAGQAVTVEFLDPATGKAVGTADITDGGKADSDGDVTAVFTVPVLRKFKFTDTWDIKVAGTGDNTYTIDGDDTPVEIDGPWTTGVGDDYAKLFIGLEPDGDLDWTWCVGDVVRVVGVGFKTGSLTLRVDTTEVKDVTTTYGYFDTTIEVPEKVRGWHQLTEYETGIPNTGLFIDSKVVLSPSAAPAGAKVTAVGTGFADEEDVDIYWPGVTTELVTATSDEDGSFTETFTLPVDPPGTYAITFDAETLPYAIPSAFTVVYSDYSWTWEEDPEDPEVDFKLLGPMRVVSLTMPSEVYNGTSTTITVNVQDYFGVAVSGATVTGSIAPPVGAAVSLTFKETIAGIYTATWAVPADAAEGTYRVDVKASKPAAGGDATASGTFLVSLKVPTPEVPPGVPPLIEQVRKDIDALSSDLSDLAGKVSGLGSDVAGLKSDIAALAATVAAIPIIPVEWIYITAIMAIIAAIAAIAAVVAVYRKIA